MKPQRFFHHNRQEFIALVVLLLLALPAVFYLLVPGFPQTDDGNWMVIRLSAFYQSLRDGEFPVRWLARLNNGYGYPVANFLYPGFMYLGVPIAVMTSSFVLTTKIIFAFSLIASPIGMYLWLKQKFTLWASAAGALAYLYAPYHLYDATVRGSIGEILVFGVLPFVFWALEKKSVFLTALFLGLLLISHNTLAILFLPVIIVYYLLLLGSDWRVISRWLGIILGIGLSLFFWIPALSDLSSTRFSQVVVSDWKEYFASFSLIGIVPLAVTSITVMLFIFFRQKIPFKKNSITFVFFLTAVMSLFLSSSISSLIWPILPQSIVQFPFRFLSLAIFSTAVLVAWLISPLKKQVILSLIVVSVSVISSLPFLFAKAYDRYDEGFYTTNQSTTTVQNEYLPRWVKEIPTSQAKNPVSSSDGGITNPIKTGRKISFVSKSDIDTNVTISQHYFPGWSVSIDGKTTEIDYTDNPLGLIEVSVPKGEHKVEANFGETPIRLVADLLSLSSLIIVALFGIKELRKKR